MNNVEIIYLYTGENRPPQAGEFFDGGRGPIRAEFDFHATSHPIMREAVDRNVEFVMDGDAICARRLDFVNLQESPCGFGNTRERAYVDLLKQEQEA